MLDNLKTQKVMDLVHTPTQEGIAGQVSGDGGKRPKMVLIINLLKEKLFTIHTWDDVPTKVVLINDETLTNRTLYSYNSKNTRATKVRHGHSQKSNSKQKSKKKFLKNLLVIERDFKHLWFILIVISLNQTYRSRCESDNKKKRKFC